MHIEILLTIRAGPRPPKVGYLIMKTNVIRFKIARRVYAFQNSRFADNFRAWIETKHYYITITFLVASAVVLGFAVVLG